MTKKVSTIGELFLVTDFVANGSFASLKENVKYKSESDYAILIRLTDNTKNWNGNYVYVSKESYDYLSKSKVFPGDLIISNVGEPGIAFIVPELGKPMTLGPNSILVRSLKPDISTEYIFYLIKSPEGQNKVAKIVSNTTIKKFNKTNFKNIELPLPHYHEQIQIAKILSKAETIIEQRKQSIALLDEFLKSTFLEMFGEPVKNAKRWEKNNVIAYADCIVPGRDKPKSFTGKTPWFTTEDLIHKGFTVKSNKNFGLNEAEIKEVRAKVIPAGSVLITCVGDLGIISICKEDCVVNQQLHAFQCKDGMNNIFLMYALSFQTKFMYKSATSTTVPYMNKTTCNSIPVIKPPIELQIEFANIVAKTETLKELYQNSLRELKNLYGSLSQKAFKGELTITKDEDLSIAAEPETAYSKLSSIPEIKKGFAKQVLGGKIVSFFKDDKNFTHIKFQKLQYLAEHIAEEDLLWNYYRQIAGPYDNKFMHNVASKLKQNKWFEERKYKFYALEKVNDIEKYYSSYFQNKHEKLNNLFSILKNASQKVCEAIATIYAVWNNHIILKQSFNKERIKNDFFEWSERKDNVFTEDEFEKALLWMQKHEIIPTGFGHLIKEKRK